MIKSRKYVNTLLSSIQSLKRKYEYEQKDIVKLTSDQDYQQTINHFNSLITKLSEELSSLPIGYRYQGKYFLKKPYSISVIFTEHDGALYMREDLISWQIESGVEPKDYAYHRTIFKRPCEEPDAIITRQDTEPVYL